MAIRKFGSYRINVENIKKSKRKDGTIKVSLDLSGNIEIGIEIDRMTWREDWVMEQVFKKDASNYRMTQFYQNDTYNCATHMEHNHVEFVAEPRNNYRW